MVGGAADRNPHGQAVRGVVEVMGVGFEGDLFAADQDLDGLVEPVEEV